MRTHITGADHAVRHGPTRPAHGFLLVDASTNLHRLLARGVLTCHATPRPCYLYCPADDTCDALAWARTYLAEPSETTPTQLP